MALEDKRLERLGLHLGITQVMVQGGTAVTLLKQQLVTLRDVAKDVIDADDLPSDGLVKIMHLLPEGIAEDLASDVVIPNDASGLED